MADGGNEDGADDSPPDESDDDSRDEEPPKVPFDARTTMCVLDTRALCALPMDADDDGAMAFRAFLLPKGKTLHVPDEPGCYATLGPWHTQIALSMVHFVKATSRKPELLLAFIDHGMLSNGKATGMFVSSLQLPLQKKRNVFEETARMTKISDVKWLLSDRREAAAMEHVACGRTQTTCDVRNGEGILTSRHCEAPWSASFKANQGNGCSDHRSH